MKLELDNSHRPFRPGDTITGYVELGPDDDGLIQKTHLILEGRAKTKSQEKSGETKHIYRARAPLLYELHPLDTSPAVTFENNTKLIPFSLVIPSKVPKLANVPTTKDGFFKSYWTYNWTDKPDFQSQAGHDLPPSFKAGPGNAVTRSQCYVEYSVTAVGSLLKSSQDHPDSEQLEAYRTDTKPFWMQCTCPMSREMFSPSKRKTIRVIHPMCVQSMQLLPAVTSRAKGKMTFKEKWKKAMSSSKLPEVKFRVALKMPSYLRVGESMTVSLQLYRSSQTGVSDRSEKKGKPQMPFPDVQVDSLEVVLKHTTHVRTRGSVSTHLDHWSDTVWQDKHINGLLGMTLPKWEGESTLRSTTSLDSKHITNQFENSRASSVNAHEALSSSRTFEISSISPIPPRLIPSFSTYNISRSYNMRVTVSMTCAGEQKFINHNSLIHVYSKPSGNETANPLHFCNNDIDRNESYVQTTTTNALSSHNAQPAERIDSGLEEPASPVEDWGEYKLMPGDKLASQEMASFAIRGLGGSESVDDLIRNVV